MKSLSSFLVAVTILMGSATKLFSQTNSLNQCLQNYRWTSIETTGKVTGRHENAFVEFQDKFYLIGGRGVNPVNVFNPKTNHWETKGKTPFEIHHFQAVVYGDAIYVVGAMTGKYPRETPVENIWIYYPKEDKWVKDVEIPKEIRRGSSGVVVYNHKIYMACGIEYGHTSGTNNLFDCYDLKTKTWESLSKAPHVRDHFSAVVVNDKLYCLGGRNSSVHYANNFPAFFWATIPEVDVYDFKTKEWLTLEDKLPVPTAAGSIVNIGDYILYMGGEGSQSQAYTHTQCLDVNIGKWTQLASLTMGRHGSGAMLFNNEIYFAAGSFRRGGSNMNTIEKFSADHNWKNLFNGKDLSGWEVKCTKEDQGKVFWTVDNGTILCNSLDSTKHNYIWLQSVEEFGDFELRLKFQASRKHKGNSGVQFRSRYDGKAEVEKGVKGWLDGPQVDIDPNNSWRNGFIYDETRNTKRWIFPDLPDWKISKEEHKPKWIVHYFEDQETGWNDMTIICKGTKIKTLVNNFVVAEYDGSGELDNKNHRKHKVGKIGHIALQLHKHSKNFIRFKDIEIRVIEN